MHGTEIRTGTPILNVLGFLQGLSEATTSSPCGEMEADEMEIDDRDELLGEFWSWLPFFVLSPRKFTNVP